MNNINYIAHKILNSNYRLFIHLVLVFVFYSFFYGNKLILCMNEDTSNHIVKIPRRDIDNVIQGLEEQIRSLKNIKNAVINPIDPVSEPIVETVPSHQVRALKKEITDFASSQVCFIEEVNRLNAKISDLQLENNKLENEITEQFIELRDHHRSEFRKHSILVKELEDSIRSKDAKIEHLEYILRRNRF